MSLDKADFLAKHSLLMIESFRRLTGRDLLPLTRLREDPAEALLGAPFALVSHGTEPDPVLNYGNRRALALWEMSWDEFVRTPSRLTAEPPDREERARFLARVAEFGFIDDYSGVRVSKGGRRFRIEGAVVWSLRDAAGLCHGQAAVFSHWHYL